MPIEHTLDKDAVAVQRAIRRLPRQWQRTMVRSGMERVARIKEAMPVDSGRAKAGWGVYTPGDLRRPNADSSSDDAVLEVTQDEFTHGTTVHYVERLNEGSSTQAPAGFLDREEVEGADDLADDMVRMLELHAAGWVAGITRRR